MLGLVLTPVALAAGVMGAWRFSADLGWTSGFFVSRGWLSRYQLWVAFAIGARVSALALNRWVVNRDIEVPARVA